MADQDVRRKPHFILEGNGETERFLRPPRAIGGGVSLQERDRIPHGSALLSQVETLRPQLATARMQQESAGLEAGFGLRVEFESFPEIELAFESLAREHSGIELLNVRHDGPRTLATVFVPDGKLHILENLIRSYLDESKDTKLGPKNHKLLNTISKIRAATLEALWTDESKEFPTTDDEAFWWEIWLPVRGDRAAVTNQFRALAEGLDLMFAPGELQFPERTVLLAYGSAGQMKRSMLTLNSIAEMRRAKETAEFFDALPPEEHAEWLEELQGRMTVPGEEEEAAHVCLFDTGVNQGHPLIATGLAGADMHSVQPGWGTDDSDGHGTQMAGLALVGNLTEALESQDPIEIGHRLESVKLLTQDSTNTGDARHHGYLTVEAVARPEITAPQRRRVFSMAVTARDNRDRGRPSAWSAAIDRLSADSDTQGDTPRLFVISAGNVQDPNAWTHYPESNCSDGVHDPGQSWNALTVGAATHLVRITEPNAEDYRPVAPAGGLSPFSTTSVTWQKHWPLKPDVVFEGGNAAVTNLYATPYAETKASLSLLTTNREPTKRLFTITNATSAASALAARMAAQLMVAYPHLWPETIRALIVHSAEWTDAMRQAFLPPNRAPNKTDMAHLVRCCGFGIPDLDRAMWSVDNSLTMVCEDQLHPFRREGSNQPTFREMNLHRLPWPLDELEVLGETRVEMRVTLSYFVEPNPSARGFARRYRYESHGLRFDVKRPLESEADFRGRLNAAARDAEEWTRSSGNDAGWVIGTQNRHRGSLHTDIWRGSAAELASRGAIGIWPALGWWKSRTKLKRYDSVARYALLVSIRAPEVEVDLYSAVASKIVGLLPIQT